MAIDYISVFDIFKIGVGPSSSHTLGPWKAGYRFLETLAQKNTLQRVRSIHVHLYGSLAKTGKGHGTDIAVMLGLQGYDPETIDTALITPIINHVKENGILLLNGKHPVSFNAATDILFHNQSLSFHPNGMIIIADEGEEDELAETWYSVGGGFIVKGGNTDVPDQEPPPQSYPINLASDIIHWCEATGKSISEIVLENEKQLRDEETIYAMLQNIFSTMQQCIYKGCHTEGILPGGLHVKRRAAGINKNLLKESYHDFNEWIAAIEHSGSSFNQTINWVSCFALAVNEENAAFGRVVTAPTNGAAGVLPAVLLYFTLFCNANNPNLVNKFLLTAAEIGSIFKKGATISAAMGGCQAEIGVSSAMAAAGLTEVLGGSPSQCLMAAEIAMEHHLGLTCDPVGGLVQIPCIERNAMGAIKAITASQLALQSDPASSKVSLDDVVKTMWYTALDMNDRYKETSEGGLAIHIPKSLSEC